ncbi:MAG: Nif11-like leader peptide family natural product precursor [Clostridia bacterium]|nr:Nif11-like leader peptide family natural product precursor [Clostridia bacterium]
MKFPQSILSKLTDEQKKRIETAKNPEEFLTIARETGYELSDEQLNAMSGGWCPDCGEDTCPSDF